ncbi:MAG: dihydroorotase [Gammaproteobacteria bacterium]
MQTLTITRPDDLHLHLRDGAALRSIIRDSVRRFARAIIMPNLDPPVLTVTDALSYRARVLAALPEGFDFRPLMTLYLTEHTTPEEIKRARDSGQVYAVKYYPAGATTHSERGVRRMENVYPVLEEMEKLGMPLLLHGEVTDSNADIFDREKLFIERMLAPLLDRFKKLRMVLEHITTQEAAEFVRNGPDTLAATITPHHLLLNRSAMFADGLRPHHYCRPVLKAEQHRLAIVAAATSGHPHFFLGTDSAPHARRDKESACGCAGIYSAHNALELYAGVFEAAGQIDRLENFASRFGADFYGLPVNSGTITLEKKDWTVPETLPFGSEVVVPLGAGGTCRWKLR